MTGTSPGRWSSPTSTCSQLLLAPRFTLVGGSREHGVDLVDQIVGVERPHQEGVRTRLPRVEAVGLVVREQQHRDLGEVTGAPDRVE